MVTLVSFRDERTAHRDYLAGLPLSWGDVRTMTRGHQKQETLRATDAVDLRVPADPAYLAVVRTATAGLAARLNLTLDEIEDLRIAVDEACGLLLDHQPHPGADLLAAFTLHPNALDVLVHGPVVTLPRRSSF